LSACLNFFHIFAANLTWHTCKSLFRRDFGAKGEGDLHQFGSYFKPRLVLCKTARRYYDRGTVGSEDYFSTYIRRRRQFTFTKCLIISTHSLTYVPMAIPYRMVSRQLIWFDAPQRTYVLVRLVSDCRTSLSLL
jgi:hypothetical protein